MLRVRIQDGHSVLIVAQHAAIKGCAVQANPLRSHRIVVDATSDVLAEKLSPSVGEGDADAAGMETVWPRRFAFCLRFTGIDRIDFHMMFGKKLIGRVGE